MEIKERPKEETRTNFGGSLKTTIVGAIGLVVSSIGGTGFVISKSENLQKAIIPENSIVHFEYRVASLERKVDDLPEKVAAAVSKEVEKAETRQRIYTDSLEARHDARIVRIGQRGVENEGKYAGLSTRVDMVEKAVDRISQRPTRANSSN